MKVTIEGKEFEIDLERAEELGVLKETLPLITNFEIGDAYRLKYGNSIVVVEAGYAYGDDGVRYSFSGFGDELRNYSSFGKRGGTREQVLEYLNAYQKKGAVFIKNINEDFKKLLKSL
jgi:hypothetical protein